MRSYSSDGAGSVRGRRSVELLPTYLADARLVKQYDPVESPDGVLQLSVAENLMLEDLLVPSLSDFAVSEPIFEERQIYYQPTHGSPELLAALNGYFENLLRLPSSLEEDGLVVGAGCNAVLENLAFALGEPGDAVLIPTPYYAAFEFDLVARAGLRIVPVEPDPEHTEWRERYHPTGATLDAAYERAVAGGNPPRILLLSQPNNPLGTCYPKAVLEECICWARRRNVHLISDEIYAGSVYRPVNQDGSHAFNSVLALAANHQEDSQGLGLGPYIHFVYSFAKDFALLGLRAGVA